MSAAIYFATKEARRINKNDPAEGRGPTPHDLETYFSPLGEIEVECSTTEREDFEGETDNCLDADVLSLEQFQALVGYLRTSYGLKITYPVKGSKP